MLKTYVEATAVVLFLSACIILPVSWWLSGETNAFRELGAPTMVRIIGFEEVAGGDDGTRRIAVAERVTDGRRPAEDERIASHILMDEVTEVGSLRQGQELEVVVLPDSEFSMTPPGYTHWFITRRSLERHTREPISEWGWNSALVLTALSLLLGAYSASKKRLHTVRERRPRKEGTK